MMYEEFPSRTQSPFAVNRSAHPGAVLLTPTPTATLQSSSAFNDLLAQHSRPSSTNFHKSHASHNSGANNSSSNINMSNNSSNKNSNISAAQAAGSALPRPFQLGENATLGFNQDLAQMCSWITNLSPPQQNVLIDNLLPMLDDEVLQSTRLKLDSLLHSGFSPSPQVTRVSSPALGLREQSHHSLNNLDYLFSDSHHPHGNLSAHGNGSMNANSNIATNASSSAGTPFHVWNQQSQQPSQQSLHQPMVHQSSLNQPMYDYLHDFQQRPKSVDPHVMQKLHSAGPSTFTPAKKNFYVSHAHSKSMTKNKSTNDFEKLSQLGKASPSSPISSSNPSSAAAVAAAAVAAATAQLDLNGQPVSSASSMNGKSLTDPKLLTNVPAWLKSLRLHKYSDSLKHKTWVELVALDDAQLEQLGVSALGARRKLLKAFAIVLDYKERGLIDASAYSV